MKLQELCEREVGFFGKEKDKKDEKKEVKKEEKAGDEKESEGPTKRVVISYATGEFPIKKALETKIKNKAKEIGAKDVDHSMSKDNVRGLHFDVPKDKVKELESFSHKAIKSYGFTVK